MGKEQREALRDKLTLLYTLEHLGKCTEVQLVRFNSEYSLMDPFQFYVALGELKEDRLIEETWEMEGKLLSITEEGRNSVSMFADDIWPAGKLQVDEHARFWKRRIRDELQMPADWERKGEDFVVSLRLIEAGEETFNLTLRAADKQQAIDFCTRWPEQASFLYRTIMERLGEGELSGSQEPGQENNDQTGKDPEQ